jgi:hypothetical protein
MYPILGNGHKLRFWTDAWLDDISIRQLAPDLVTVVPKRRLKHHTAVDALLDGS